MERTSEAFRRQRKALELPQSVVAEGVIDRSHLARWELGQRRVSLRVERALRARLEALAAERQREERAQQDAPRLTRIARVVVASL